MIVKLNPRKLPLQTWGEPRAITIAIKHMSPEQAELERRLKPASWGRPRKRFVSLNPVSPV